MEEYNIYLIASCVFVDTARCLAIASLVLVSIWAGANFKNFLGTPNISSNPIAWHAVLMTAGLFFSLIMVTTLQCTPWEYTFWYRHFHIHALHVVVRVWHTVVIIMASIGIFAAVKYCNTNSISHASTLHSWIGIIALICVFHNSFVELVKCCVCTSKYFVDYKIFYFEAKSLARIQLICHCHDIIFGALSFISITLSLLTGIAEFLPSDSCMKMKTLNPSYSSMSSGCKLGNGLGLLIFFASVATLVAVIFNNTAANIARLRNIESLSNSRSCTAVNNVYIAMEVDHLDFPVANSDNGADEETKTH